MGSSRFSTPASVSRFADRLERLPKTLFAATFVVSLFLLAAAFGNAPDPDRQVTAATELTHPQVEPFSDSNSDPGLENVEILEYGFGVIELHGRERFSVGAVVNNTHQSMVTDVRFEVEATGAGDRSPERFRINDLAPGREALVGHVFSGEAADWAGFELALRVSEVSGSEPDPSTGFLEDRFTVIGTERLVFPEGHRIVYRIESELDQLEAVRVDVVFRDGRGAIVGGVGGARSPADGADSTDSFEVPPGTSIHHFDLVSGELPEGADLDQTEIGPGGLVPGG